MWFFEALALGFFGRLLWRAYSRQPESVIVQEVKRALKIVLWVGVFCLVSLIVLSFVALKMYP